MLRRYLGVRAAQVPADQHQVCQSEQRQQLCVVFGQAAVARLALAGSHGRMPGNDRSSVHGPA